MSCSVLSCMTVTARRTVTPRSGTGTTTICGLLGSVWRPPNWRVARVDPDWAADVLHVNDWPAALAPAYIAWRGQRTPSILTIHNLAYQGNFSRDSLGRIGAPDSAFQIDGIEFYNQVSFMKAGIVYANQITTVSETYAREILEPAAGHGLDGLLRKRAKETRLTGILNGIDENWDPRTCTHLAKQFEPVIGKESTSTPKVSAATLVLRPRVDRCSVWSRAWCIKRVLISSCRSPTPSFPPAVRLSSWARAKASSSQRQRNWAQRHRRSVAVKIGFDEAESRRILAGSDFMLMPSRFEPCGLSQMCAQRVGTLPIGHKTGGLAETIDDGQTGFPVRRALDWQPVRCAVPRLFDIFVESGGSTRCARAPWRATSVGSIRP